jgi:L-glyceraldehyde 3-phosphate reductase
LSSLDQSLKRMGVDYVDIFYSHRPDPETPIEETMMALDHAVRCGKALYVGISNYSAEQSKVAIEVLKELGTPCFIHQAKYSMFQRWVEQGLLDVLEDKGVGCIAFSPLAQGLLTDKYVKGIPENSRAFNPNGHLKLDEVSREKIQKVIELDEIAKNRNQTLAQMALAWLLKDNRITSVLIGASSVGQLNNNLDSLLQLEFTSNEIENIEEVLR